MDMENVKNFCPREFKVSMSGYLKILEGSEGTCRKCVTIFHTDVARSAKKEGLDFTGGFSFFLSFVEPK